ADRGATYDIQEEINLSEVVPLIAKPSSPGNVVPVKEMEGTPIYQSYIGSSANPGFRDFAIAAQIVAGKQIAEGVSFDINPTSRQMLTEIVDEGQIADRLLATAGTNQVGSKECCGMSRAPEVKGNVLRRTPRDFT